MQNIFKDRLRIDGLIVLAISGLLWTHFAFAVESVKRYRIPAQSLNNALLQFAADSGLELIINADKLRGLQSVALDGRMTATQALDRLLQGSGIDYRYVDDNVVTLEFPQQRSLNTESLLAGADDFVLTEAEPEKGDHTGPVAQEDMTVTGSTWSGYNVLKANTATKTDTPILETPVSIQVVPKEVIQDQQIQRIKDVVENVSGVRPQTSIGRGTGFTIRGFHNNRIFRNGLIATGISVGDKTEIDTANLESVEVLKGPAAVLFGRIEPGGLVNIVTKRPTKESQYSVQQLFGSYNTYRTEWDATGAITDDKELSYRFNGSYQDSDSFRDFNFSERYLLNPSLFWQPTDATKIMLEVEAMEQEYQVDRALFAIGNRPASIPIGRSFIDPNDPVDRLSRVNLGFQLTHAFNDNWVLHNRFLATFNNDDNISVKPANAFTVAQFLDPSAGNRSYLRNIFSQEQYSETYTTNLDLTGKFETRGVKHETLLGFDYLRSTGTYRTRGDLANPIPGLEIDIYNPVYGIDPSVYANALATNLRHSYFRDEWYGVYFQDHITLWDSLHILGGGRYDWATTGRGRGDSFSAAEADLPSRNDEGFSPRVGILYQPWDWFSIYGNWTTSFGANNGTTATGGTIDPEIGEQFEAGIKTELFDQRLTTTLAYYHLTKENIMTRDFNSPDPFARAAIGEARSQGIELDMTGQFTDEISVIGSYTFTDARITKDYSGLQDNRLNNVPEHSGSLWLKYQVKEFEPLNGWSFGIGMFAAGQRQGDDANTFVLPGYVRLDAFTSYSRQFRDSRLITQFNIRNLLDKTYYESTDPFQSAPPRVGIYPGEPLTAMGSIRLEF